METDWPQRFYFNGHELPKWSAQWHWCEPVDRSDAPDDWDEFVHAYRIWKLQCRLDHVGTLESEDSLVFRVCAQDVLHKLLAHRAEVTNLLSDMVPEGALCADVYEGLVEGVFRMIELSVQDGYALWTSGSEADQQRLLDFISELPASGDRVVSFDLPHVAQERRDLEIRSTYQIKRLRTLAQSGTLEKYLRVMVMKIPDQTMMQP